MEDKNYFVEISRVEDGEPTGNFIVARIKTPNIPHGLVVGSIQEAAIIGLAKTSDGTWKWVRWEPDNCKDVLARKLMTEPLNTWYDCQFFLPHTPVY